MVHFLKAGRYEGAWGVGMGGRGLVDYEKLLGVRMFSKNLFAGNIGKIYFGLGGYEKIKNYYPD